MWEFTKNVLKVVIKIVIVTVIVGGIVWIGKKLYEFFKEKF